MQYILKAPEHFPPPNIFFVLRKWLHYTLVTIQAHTKTTPNRTYLIIARSVLISCKEVETSFSLVLRLIKDGALYGFLPSLFEV
jgi:hypothetical protein